MSSAQYLTVKDVVTMVTSTEGRSLEYRNFNLVQLLDAGAGGLIFYIDTKSE